MKHDEDYLYTFRHDQPDVPTFTGIEVIAECKAYHEHMSVPLMVRIKMLEAALEEEHRAKIKAERCADVGGNPYKRGKQ